MDDGSSLPVPPTNVEVEGIREDGCGGEDGYDMGGIKLEETWCSELIIPCMTSLA